MAEHDFITTENFEESGEHRGRVRVLDSYRRNDSNLTFMDLAVENVDGTRVELHRVETGKLMSLANDAETDARVLTPEESRLKATGSEPVCVGCGHTQENCSPSCGARVAGGWER